MWITWINDQAHVNIKNTLRSRVGKLLAPVYKTTESTMKRLIKAAGKMVQKHTDRHNKYKKKEQDDQREQEDKWDRNRTKSTTHLSGRLREARHSRDISLARGEQGHCDLNQLDAFYDNELFPSHWSNVGSVDPWELMFAFHEQAEPEE